MSFQESNNDYNIHIQKESERRLTRREALKRIALRGAELAVYTLVPGFVACGGRSRKKTGYSSYYYSDYTSYSSYRSRPKIYNSHYHSVYIPPPQYTSIRYTSIYTPPYSSFRYSSYRYSSFYTPPYSSFRYSSFFR